MPQDNSSKIRRQIGFFKKLIQRSCASIPQTFTDYDIDEKHPKFDRLDEDQLESLRLELHNIRSSLLKAYSRITSLHDEWTALQQSDPRESKQFDEYITKYGDYRTSVTQAVTQLEELDLLLNEVDNEFRGRDLSVSSDSSENPVSNGRFDVKSSQQDDQPLASQMPHPQRPPFSTSPNAVHAPYTNNALLNFVDASILSKMELPTFDGNMLEFPEFASRFATLVGNKAELDDTTKFSLLKSCLRGRASHAIQGLSVTAENYKIAMDILNTHFNDKVTIKHVLYSKLAELPACDPEGRNLHTLYNRMFALIRQFANGNDDSKETGLGAILLNKLPLRVKSKIYDKTANSHNLSPSELLHLLTDIVRKDTTLQEMSHHTRSTTPQDQYLTFHASSKIRNKRAPPNMIRGNRHQSKPCSFCKAANHLPINCHVFSTAQRRIQYVRDNSLCYNCLSNKHFTRDCTSRRVCIFCTKRHHSSLCSRQDRQKPRTPTSNSFTPRRPSERQSPKNRQRVTHTAADTTFTSDEIPQSHEDGNDEGILTTSNSSTLNALSMTTTLMCTTVTIFNPSDSSKTLAVTAFLDSGSSHSYIREDVAKALDLPVKHPENITISTFGTNAPLHLKSHDHVIGIHTRKGDQQLSVKSLPTLTGNLKHVQLDRTCKENCVKVFHSQPSLLIGNDYFWDMVLCDNFSYETLPNGFRLFQTNIGEVLTGTIHHHLTTLPAPLSPDLLRNTYVDNVFHGVENTNEGKHFYACSKELFKRAGMNLRAYVSNSEELNDFFESKESGKISQKQKLLGLHWNINTDELSIPLPYKNPSQVKSTKWTKRKVLKETASIFDPLGLVSPVTLIAKLFLQSLWKINIGWDDELPTDQHMQWLQIMDTWNIPSLTINRLLFPTNIKDASEYELHVFTDASANAYCATAYLVQHQENSPREVSLIMAKSRLAPLHQSITIPRLELSALTIGAKLLTYITKQVDISFTKKFLWTDSTVALTWTKGDKQVPIFVRNRVKTIQENTSNVLIRHVPTASNPADIGTRGATIDELQTLSQWWKGPPFLALDEAHWPESDEKHVQGASPQEEQPDEAYMAVQTNTTNPEDSDTEPRSQDTEKVIDPTRFSKWVTLLHTVTIVLRFLVLCSSKAATIFGRNNIQFIRRAENILLRIAQQENPPTSDQKKQLHLFLCEKTLLWKSEGRLKNAFLPQEAINPTFLPNKNYITTLLILYFHSNNNHCGVNHTLTALRQRFWIPKGRSAVKRAIRNHCYHCRRYNAKPFTLPPFPVHPIQRVTPPQYPFQRMGMDFFGPMQYRSESNIIEKYWMLLFTCLNSRAIYVDIVLNMTTQSVLHVLRRFIATVGCPTWIVCDNALSFKKVAECYSSLPNPDIDKDIIDYCTKKRIQIKFIPSLSPWQGGIYEKMIDIFKKSFKHAIGNRVMNLDDIKTIAKEAEAIVNTRPLTYITDDSDHIPLRPIDFLRPSALLSGPNPDDPPEEWQPLDNTREALLIAWHKTSEALNTFWKRWTYEYLTSLREQYRRTHKTPRSHEEEPPKLNNIVMIHDSTLNKGQWKLGRIIGSKDNYQRSVDIRLPSKKVITRPLNLVYNLEVSSMHQQDERDNSNQGQSQQNAPTGHHMVTRSKARLNVNAITLCVSIFFAQAAFAFNTRCPNEISINKTILYATNCAKEGIAIARYSHQKEERMCWFPVSCPLGAIRSGYPYKNGSTLCGKTCECPKWATSCSFSDSDRISFSELDMIPLSIRNYKPKQVCSFNASPKCDHKKQVGHFHQVQLFDQNLLLVEELTISIKEYIDETDFLCIDRKGWKRRAQKSITGTSRFCEKHLCAPKAKLFCAYDNPLAMLVINDTESSTSIPIKAWGTITKFYFGFPTKLTEAKKDVDAINKSCSKGGISIQSNTTFDVAEVCIHHYCVFLKGITSQTVLFPNKLVMYDYVASIKIWNQGELSYDSELSCKAHPICEILQCYLCWERFYNTQCWNYKHFTIFMLCGATILLAAPLLCIFFKFVRLTFTIMKIILKRLNPIRYLRLPRRQRSFRLPAYTNRRKKKQQKRFISCTILILIQLLQVEGCSEVISVTSTEEVCTIQENKETCTFNHATTITLQPLQQQTCLTLNDPEKRPMGMLTVKPDGIKFRCNKKIEFFTRDHQIVSESVHRCHRAGSCHSDECHHVKDTDALPEFSSEANSRPGYTSCSSSCGCITCDGCFFCEPSCLFHRLYAIPTTPTIYSIFYCPSWELEVDAEISLQREDETTTSTIRLLPGRTSTWNNIRFSLIGTIVPQLPILSSAFVTNGRQTSIVKPAYAGQLQSNSVGQLQCPNLEAAKQFECHFSRNLCTCTNALHKVSCTCYDGSVEDHMEALPLPQTSKNFLVFEKDRNIYAKTHVGSALQLHIVAQDLKITTVKHTSHCQVEASDLSGCYSCTSGASLTLSCKSDNGEVLANMKCNEQTHVIRCTESGFINNILLMFDTSEVAADCTAACPGGIVNFTIKGLLAFVNERIISQSYSATDVERNIKRDFSFVNYLSEMISLFVNKITSFFSFWKTVAFLIVIIVLLELITKLFTKPLHDKAH
ncbi:Pao retrotransposon peptidase [Ancylostoma ceylanicum]|uniref:Pao retrotransposon peptidase n=1 Tax=Ancylostoma ceylanicum TaxID=53326 RepID=A0A0D6M885_9BILA|nr:Pao retrotransposon peptidase [Ancylostoma ceylanicum]